MPYRLLCLCLLFGCTESNSEARTGDAEGDPTGSDAGAATDGGATGTDGAAAGGADGAAGRDGGPPVDALGPDAAAEGCAAGVRRERACGLNDRGLQRARCDDGAWGPWDECADPDVCVDDASRAVDCAFGPGRETCVAGAWADRECPDDPGECENGVVQEAPCGLNRRGRERRECVEGAWVEAPCVDPDACVDGAEQQAPCGLNGRGVQVAACADGQWGPGECVDPDECTDGASEDTRCGPNDGGQAFRTCEAGRWSEFGDCLDGGDCVNAAVEQLACGLNGRGARARRCEDGRWGEFGPCDDADRCVDGAAEDRACGINGRGAQGRRCAAGAWSPWGACADPDACVDGGSDRRACGLNGRGVEARACADGQWGGWLACVDPDECVDGQAQTRACGDDGEQGRACVDGRWTPWDPCVEPIECVGGQVEAMACGRNGRGEARRRCEDGDWGDWGACVDPDVCFDGEFEFVACDVGEPAINECVMGQLMITRPCADPDCPPDIMEPNDDPAEPPEIGLNGVLEGLRVCQDGDPVDHYLIEVVGPTDFRVSVTGDDELEVFLVNERGQRFSGGVRAGNTAQAQMALNTGRYRVQVRPLGPRVAYSLETTSTPLAICGRDPAPCWACFDAYEPNDTPLTARRLPLDAWVDDLTLCAAGGRSDYYAIPLPEGHWVDVVVDVRHRPQAQLQDIVIAGMDGFPLNAGWQLTAIGSVARARVVRGANESVFVRLLTVNQQLFEYDLRASAVAAPLAACDNGVDDDDDGLIDRDDPSCEHRYGDREDFEFDADCSNGIDDDGDGQIDWPHDVDCQGAGHLTEWGPCTSVEDTVWIEAVDQNLRVDLRDLPNVIEDRCEGFVGEAVYAVEVDVPTRITVAGLSVEQAFFPRVSLRAHCDQPDTILSCGVTPFVHFPAWATSAVDPGTYFIVLGSADDQEGQLDVELTFERL